MKPQREINDPMPYGLAIDHICESKNLKLSDQDDRQRAHFHLERSVGERVVRCAWVDRNSGRPICAIRTFRGGVGWSDLARNGGHIDDRIYEATDLDAAFPIVVEQAELPAKKLKSVRQPAQIWETFALELGVQSRSPITGQ